MESMTMYKLPRLRRTARAVAGSVVIALVVAGAATWAIAHGGDATNIHSCVNDGRGIVRVVGAGDACERGEHALDWATAGPAGAQGPQGPQGPQGEKGDAGTADVAGFGSALAGPPLALDNGVSVVVSKALDAGNYVLFATAEVIGAGTAGQYQGGYSPVECWIPGYKTDTYYLAPNGATYTGGGQVTMSLTSVVSHPGGDLALECKANWGNPSHVRRASLSAIKVSSLG